MNYELAWNRREARTNEPGLDRIANAARAMAEANADVMMKEGSPSAYRQFQEAELAFARAMVEHYEILPMTDLVDELEQELGVDAETMIARDQAEWEAQRADDMLSYRSATGAA